MKDILCLLSSLGGLPVPEFDNIVLSHSFKIKRVYCQVDTP